MIELATEWVGLKLRSPIVVGACPLTDDLEALRTCVRAGAGAIVMRSLFEEQIIAEQVGAFQWIDSHVDTDAEARSFLPESEVFGLGSQPYLSRLRKLRAEFDVPIIASLNGATPGGWIDLARDLEGAGAAAIELNLYDIATSAAETGAAVEVRQLSVIRSIVQSVGIPVIAKLSSFYSSLPAFVHEVEQAGAKGVVVFNRFYQPDVDLDSLDVSRELRYSTNVELPLRLHACALLVGNISLNLGVSGGVHHGDDAAKAILSGATTVQVVSALLEHGPERMAKLIEELCTRLSKMGYRTVDQARSVLSLGRTPDPHAWERLNYARLLQSWQPRNLPGVRYE